MIIPTPEFDPMFANDGVPFREKMIGYIRQEFPDVLGNRVAHLQADIELEQLPRYIKDFSSKQPHRKKIAA